MPTARHCCLSIAGFDPSGGAGLLADIKTFEQHKVMGMGVVTGITFQNDSVFEGVNWTTTEEIIRQIEILTRKFAFRFLKIGMIKDLDTLNKIISFCDLHIANCQLIWDPILKASAGYEIHKYLETEKLIPVLKKVYLLTPNIDEVRIMTGEKDEIKGAKILSRHCNVFLKGGHADKKTENGSIQPPGKDLLFTMDGKIFPYKARKVFKTGKHGSGCVLSSAITANLTNGLSLQRSCLKGKDYISKLLNSNKTLLGYHKM